MGDDSFNRLRLSLMQDFLPVSFAMMERIRQGGPGKVVEAFNASQDFLDELREEGEPAAKDFRDRLDQVSPGLGNPVMEVSVAVDKVQESDNEEDKALNELLIQIDQRLDCLNELIDDTSQGPSSKSIES